MVPLKVLDSPPNAIEAVGLSKRYGRVMACQNVNLLVRSGEIFGFLGPNGAGKSTVVKILLGLVPASQGTARLLGRSYKEREVHRRIGYLPELFRYPPWLTVREVVTWHARLARVLRPGPAVAEALITVGLGDRSDVRVGTLSKGLQQRLGLAVAIVADPDLLFLDEPTSAMDPVGRHEVGVLLRQWRARGKTVFLNSHLLADLEGLCDRVALIDRGQLLDTGGLSDVLAASAAYEFATGPVPSACLEELRAQGIAIEGADGRWTYAGPRDKLPRVHQIFSHHGVDVYEVVPVRQSLESWFLASLQEKEVSGDDPDRASDHLGNFPS